MNILTALPLTILRVQYTMVRYPLHLIDDQVIARLGPVSPVRRLYRDCLCLLDGVVGTVLGPRDPAHRLTDTAPQRTNAPVSSVTAAEDETVSQSATGENAELSKKAAQQLDSDVLAEHLEAIDSPPRRVQSVPTGTASAAASVLATFTGAASDEPDTTLTDELAGRVAELARAESPPPGVETIPTDKHH
ncbi:hypothetical protein P3H15_50655 [Rhodococcus sp. T2V]|uniref:hypothetical protein n=1 Tax=Rhodococcus sp. T2V TaxID=3034164 RepID=UPI0023E167DF|nr:hypothetical protein [Rhodococcus sp. T2V]MDF3313183.1 hypothetical protein [Rhodococcus sp. T2V]